MCVYNKVMRLWLTIETQTFYEICQFSVNYKSVMFHNTGPWFDKTRHLQPIYLVESFHLLGWNVALFVNKKVRQGQTAAYLS